MNYNATAVVKTAKDMLDSKGIVNYNDTIFLLEKVLNKKCSVLNNIKLTEQEYDEMLYYCDHDVDALFPIFDILITRFKSKFIIARLGKIDEEYALSLTDANLTAVLLGAERVEHDDPFGYEYPDVIDKTKIPKQALDYFDDLIAHNDLDYKVEAPCLDLKTIDFQLGVGGCHGFIKDGVYRYDRGDDLTCEF